jgi:DNA-binding transcriptional LysR family regulator
MELRQLEYFVAVAEEASFTKAARRVHVAQPGVSAQIRRLERELGHELLDRSGRTVRVTEVGRSVLPHARAALAAVAAARTAVDDLAGLVRGHVAVGMVTACASLDLTDLLAGFNRLHPGVEISLSEGNSDQLLQGLRGSTLDLAWVGLAGLRPTGIETLVLIDEGHVAAVPFDDALASKPAIRLSALRERALISMPVGTGLRTCLDDACAAAGFEPRVALEASAPNIIAELALRGLGVAILPESVAAAYAAQLHGVAITHPRLRSRIELAWRAGGGSSPAARALIAYAREFLAVA